MIKRRQAPHVIHLNKYFCIEQWCHGETFFFICMWRLNRVQILLFFSIDLITGFIVWLSDSHVLISVLFLYYVRCVCVYIYIYMTHFPVEWFAMIFFFIVILVLCSLFCLSFLSSFFSSLLDISFFFHLFSLSFLFHLF